MKPIKIAIVGFPKTEILTLLEPYVQSGQMVLVDVDDITTDVVMVMLDSMSEAWHIQYQLPVGRVVNKPLSKDWEEKNNIAVEKGLLRHAEFEEFLKIPHEPLIIDRDIVMIERPYLLKCNPRFEEPFIETPTKGYYKPTPFFQSTGLPNGTKEQSSFNKARSKRKRKN